MLFRDRKDAGIKLAAALSFLRNKDCVVLALPRGGVPVAAEVAAALNAPLDLVMVRKIGAPRHPEFAIGAVVDGGAPLVVREAEAMRQMDVGEASFNAICDHELAEIERRRTRYLAGRKPVELNGRIVIVVDDGLATGSTMRVALHAVREHGPALLVAAVPVAPRETLQMLDGLADRVVCLAAPEPFGAVGLFYDDFDQVSDEEVVNLLSRFGGTEKSPARR